MTKRIGSSYLLPTLFLIACQGDKDDTAGAVEEKSPWEIPSVVGVSNMDDDDENGTDDWTDEGVAEDNDLTPLELPAALFEGGGVLQITLSGDTEQLRVWHDGEILLDASTLTAELEDAGQDIQLEIEFDGFLTEGILDLQLVRENETVEDTTIQLLSAPLLIGHHLQWGEAAYALDDPQENADYIAGFENALGDAFTGYRMARH